MKNFCIFCGKPLVGGSCTCADYKAYYGYGDSAADMVFRSDPGRDVIETPATGARAENPVHPPVIPDTGPTVYAPITPGVGAFGADPVTPAVPVTPVAPVTPAPVTPAPRPVSGSAAPGFGFKPAPEKKTEKASGDLHFKSAGDL